MFHVIVNYKIYLINKYSILKILDKIYKIIKKTRKMTKKIQKMV